MKKKTTKKKTAAKKTAKIKPEKLKRLGGPFTLGETYTDSIHGNKGIAVVYAIHLTGCNRVCLEWVGTSGVLNQMWVDETRLLDSRGKLVVPEGKPGACDDPPPRNDV